MTPEAASPAAGTRRTQRFRLATPRGCLSSAAVWAFGIIAGVFANLLIVALYTSRDPPTGVAGAAAFTFLIYAALMLDRRLSRTLVVHLFGEDGDGHYEVRRKNQLVERGSLKPPKLLLLPQHLPGAAGRIIVPTYALMLIPDHPIPGRAVEVAGHRGYILLSRSDITVLLDATLAVCERLQVSMEDVVLDGISPSSSGRDAVQQNGLEKTR